MRDLKDRAAHAAAAGDARRAAPLLRDIARHEPTAYAQHRAGEALLRAGERGEGLSFLRMAAQAYALDGHFRKADALARRIAGNEEQESERR